MQVADNCATNIKAAEILEIPHVGCHNHLLNSEVNSWVKKYSTVENTLESVKKTMKSAKNSLKNSAVLRKLTRLTPEVGNKTRWTSWGTMMEKYLRIRQQLITAAVDDDTNLDVDTSAAFKRKAEKILAVFQDINMVALSLQTRSYTLASCRRDLDELLTECSEGHTNQDSNWYQRKLPGTYILRNSAKLPDPHFVSGIIKIQNNQLLHLTPEEKTACERVRNQGHEEEEGDNTDIESLARRLKIRMKKRKAGVLESSRLSPYINVNFICGSAAEVERLWSIAKYILSNTRSRLTPNLFQALMFLKINQEYWDCRSVQQAYTEARKQAQSERVKKMMEEDEEVEGDDLDIDVDAE